jgi:hypothetical protein
MQCEVRSIASADVTKWASAEVSADNPDEYAEIITRKFRHGLRIGVNTGITGLPVVECSKKTGGYNGAM